MTASETPKKPQLKFKANIPAEVELTFDEPRTGEGEYGEWFMYGCKHDGEEKVFFPSKTLHTIIQMLSYKEGSKFTILKVEQDDGKMKFTVDGKDFDQVKKEIENNPAEKSDGEEIPF